MSSVFGGPSHGRHKAAERLRRRSEFLRVLSTTGSFAQAIEESGMPTQRLPEILDDRTFAAVWDAIRAGEAGPLAVEVTPRPQADLERAA